MMVATKSFIRRADESGTPLLLIRLFLGGLFIYMGVKKIGDPIAFLKQIRLYEMLPETPAYFLNGTAIVLPWLEVFCGIALILGLWIRGAALWIAIMLGVFTPAIFIRTIAIHNTVGTPFFQIAFDCGCGTGEVTAWTKLLSNIALVMLALLAWLSRSRRFSLTMLIDARRAMATYCRRCGYALQEDSHGRCESCKGLVPAPVAAPDAVT